MGTLATAPNLVSRARAIIRRAIETSDGPLPPIFVVHFLLRDWQRYLTSTRDANGEDSVETSSAIETAAILLWSVMPLPSEDEKTELRTVLPSLVNRLTTGMTIIGLSAENQSAFLQSLQEWHIRILSGKGGYETISATFDPTRTPSSDDTVQLRAQDLRCRELMDMLDNAAIEYIDMDLERHNNWASS